MIYAKIVCVLYDVWSMHRMLRKCVQLVIMKDDRIGVFVRVRPYQQRQPPSTFILSLTEKEIAVRDKDREKEQDLNFSFDHIFPIKATQAEVFQNIGQPIVDSAFEGINGTIFAYGQTSSGKTYTCVGPDCEDPQDRGLLPRSVSAIFQRIAESPNFIEFRIKVSMVEIYMQKIRDLLEPSKVDLKLRENKAKGIYIQDVTEEYVSSAQQAMKVFKRGVGNRVVAFTSMNDVSSRSHMAFILTLHQNNLRDGSAKSAKLTVIDLAGSEKVSKTHAQGRVLDEAKQINKSLSSLGNVINALTDHKTNHIPYRDSKLTRLLQESIGGNSKTSLIINISPSAYNAGESISSLRFGYRAKEIKNKPKVNKEYTIGQLLVLLEKSEKRNQELELMLKQLTANAGKRGKAKSNPYVQNLLDSDNPIMSALEDEDKEKEEAFKTSRSALKTIKKCYESEMGSEGEEEGQAKSLKPTQSLAKLAESSQEITRLKVLVQEREEELRVLSDQLVRVNNERVENGRELDITKQRLQLVLKEARLNVMKLNAQKRQSEQLLQKYIKETLESQQKEANINKLQSKIVDFEEKFMRLSQLQQEQNKKSNVFGVSLGYNEQTSKIIEEALKNADEGEQSKNLIQQSMELQKQNKQLRLKIRDLQRDLTLLSHLEKAKEELIAEKLRFVEERDRVYKDLENRIQKVLQLQEKLDQEKERRKNLEEIVSMEQSQKGRKILSLQSRVHQMSENYYVLKGQQSSWLKNNKKIEDRVADLQAKIIGLQGDNMELRAQIQNMRMRCEELQSLNQNQSQLQMQWQDEQQGRGKSNIVKVIRSDIFAKS